MLAEIATFVEKLSFLNKNSKAVRWWTVLLTAFIG